MAEFPINLLYWMSGNVLLLAVAGLLLIIALLWHELCTTSGEMAVSALAPLPCCLLKH
jgi:hypothetical protein